MVQEKDSFTRASVWFSVTEYKTGECNVNEDCAWKEKPDENWELGAQIRELIWKGGLSGASEHGLCC